MGKDTGAHSNMLCWSIVPVVAVASGLLVVLRISDVSWAAEVGLGPSPIAVELVYQITSLGLALVVIGLAFALATDQVRTYFRLGNLSADFEPVPWLGIEPDEGETWREVGRNFAVIITAVTTAVVYFQVVREGEPELAKLLRHLHWVIGFATINAFVEESITRLSLIAPLSAVAPKGVIYGLSAVIFGGVHYFGAPGGPAGVFLAGFLGWFLAKSVVETRGLFWAWLIHFLQDVVIFGGFFLASGAR